MPAQRLVLFVEGKGDVKSIPNLAARILIDKDAAQDYLFVDKEPFRIKSVNAVTGNRSEQWTRYLRAAYKSRPHLGAILLVLDGDNDFVENRAFCAKTVALLLAERARAAGAGANFSLACVFAVREFEAWLMAGVESLAGKKLRNGGSGIRPGTKPPQQPEAIRGCKEWLGDRMTVRYNPAIHQLPFVQMLDIATVRAAGLRSFARLEKAIDELLAAVRTGHHVSTPMPPSSGGSLRGP